MVTPLIVLSLVKFTAAAFVASPICGTSWSQQYPQRSALVHSAKVRSTSPCDSTRMQMTSGRDETTDDKIARLRETAAEFRAQVASLEIQQEQERRAGANRSFAQFDVNNDGAVDVTELQEGLAGPLRESFIKQITKSIGRKPRPEEVEERIAQLPGGTLFPDDLARKLIKVYDCNNDGVLQESEFAPTEELRTRLENMFRERQDEERRAKAAERAQEIALKTKAAGGMSSRGITAGDKALSTVPYLLPMMDGIVYSAHLFMALPEQTSWAQPLAAVLLGLRSIPFFPLIMFFGMSFLSRNQQVNKLVRFNMRQAINFDLALIPPSLLAPLIDFSLREDAYKVVPLTQAGSDILFISLVAAIAYSIGSSALGYFPNKLPFFGRINRDNPDYE